MTMRARRGGRERRAQRVLLCVDPPWGQISEVSHRSSSSSVCVGSYGAYTAFLPLTRPHFPTKASANQKPAPRAHETNK